MKLTKKLEAEILKVYQAILDANFSGDIKTFASFLDNNVTIYGSAAGEIFTTKNEAVKYYQATADQVTGKTELRNRKIGIKAIGDAVVINEQCDMYFLAEGAWMFYGHTRITGIIEQKRNDWKIVHMHGSFPDSRTEEGEQIATEKIKTENIQLREAVQRRTVELESKNKELQIEAALERVRTVAMAMKKADDMLDICKTIAQQMKQLGVNEIRNVQTAIFYESRGTYMNYEYYAKHDKTFITDVDYKNHKIQKAFATKMMKGANEEVLEHLKGKKLHDWFAYQKTTNQFADKFLLTADSLNYYWYSLGPVALGTSSYYPLTKEETDLFKRFLKVFELAYRRYLDIENAETQAREAKIEAALERVRSRSLAMHNSEELKQVVSLLYDQLESFGFAKGGCELILCNEKSGYLEYWHTNPVQSSVPQCLNVSPGVHDFFDRVWKAWKEQEFQLVIEMRGKEKHKMDLALLEKTDFKNTDKKTKTWILNERVAVFSHAVMKYGLLEAIDFLPLSEDQFSILHRFAKVFEQAYTRFLDLQKAEAQAREAQIEASMERVRSRTMAMQKSGELREVAVLLYNELKALGITQQFFEAGYVEIDEVNKIQHGWMTTPAGDFLEPFDLPLTGEPVFDARYEAWKQHVPVFVQVVEGTELKRHLEYAIPLMGNKEAEEIAKTQVPDRIIFYSGNFSDGYLAINSGTPISIEAESLLARFTRVFEQTYKRFLDLQKAEALARESQIEAALERVRSRSMGMQKSEELGDVIQVIYEQMVGLNIKIDGAGFAIDFRESDDWNIWNADAYTPFPTKIYIPYFDHPVANAIIEAKNNGVELVALNLTIEERNTLLDHVFKYAPASPEAKEVVYNTPGFAESDLLLKNVLLFIHNYAGIPYTDAENAILIRFGKVFEQTYTRFKDLEKAEMQALEAIKRASVDRVRAEIASMRTTADLDRITPLIWNELTTLGVPFIRCGVFIMDEEEQQVHTYLTNPEGEAIAAFHQPYNAPGEIVEVVKSWRKKGMYTQHWDEARFVAFTKDLVQQGAITSGEKYLTENRPTDLYLHFLPFLQGMLYVGNTAPLSDDALQLVQNLADAFSTAYARYEDFNKLEAAKQQVDKTLTDLKQAQSQLVQAEKMASLGELTAGIAHEIQNPLNFVNNFSELSNELIEEMQEEMDKGNREEAKQIASDIRSNLEKINLHGKRADAIVKGMLQHSRTTSGEKQPTDINALADEFLRLAYHGLRAKDNNFNVILKTAFDPTVGKVSVISQDIGRVLLNLINNAFYALSARAKATAGESAEALAKAGSSYEPTLVIRTKKHIDKIEIIVQDNGGGIPQKVLAKIFQPFFTTKPTGQGTGLGLSLSYDIVKGHGGELRVETKEGEGSEFLIQLPIV